MKKIVLNYLVIAALTVMVAFTSCNKDDNNDGKGEGALATNGTSYSITESCMCVRKDGTVNEIVFSNNGGRVVSVSFTNGIELTSKTYTANEVEVISLYQLDFDEDNVEMVVNKSGKTYDITITGVTKRNEHEYTMTYKGNIRAEKDLCNQ